MNTLFRPTIESAEQVFFEEIIHGWASAITPRKKEQSPFFGHRVIFPRKRNDSYSLLDMYSVTDESRFFSGTTTLFHFRIPIWRMNYEGWVDRGEEISDFIKEALRTAYKMKDFFGGRGPFTFNSKKFLYKNTPGKNSFSDFHGEEMVFDIRKGIQVEWVRYSGLWLVE